jgi:hypothetical protein
VEASIHSRAGQRTPRFEHFAESFKEISGGCGSVRMAWRAHADDKEFDEACEPAAGLWFKDYPHILVILTNYFNDASESRGTLCLNPYKALYTKTMAWVFLSNPS